MGERVSSSHVWIAGWPMTAFREIDHHAGGGHSIDDELETSAFQGAQPTPAPQKAGREACAQRGQVHPREGSARRRRAAANHVRKERNMLSTAGPA